MGIPYVKEDYMRRVNREEILTLSRDSVVTTVRVDGQLLIRKSYQPESYPSYASRYRKIKDTPYLGIDLSGDKTSFRKEVGVLAASAELASNNQFAPKLMAVHAGTRSFFMEKVDKETFRDYFVRGNGIREKTRELIDILAQFHFILGNNQEKLYQCVSGEDGIPVAAFLPRTKQKDRERWARYFKTIVYRASSDFAEYSGTIKSAWKIKKKAAKRALRSFLHSKGLDLEEMVDDFIERDWLISFGSEYQRRKGLISPSDSLAAQQRSLRQLYQQGLITLIHGDFRPQNVFRTSGDDLQVCDFPEMRIDRRAVDLIGAIYNIYNSPQNATQEVAAIRHILDYAEKVKEKEGIELDRRQFTVQTMEARLKYGGVGLFAVDCRYIAPEIKVFTNGWSKFPPGIDDKKLEQDFLEEMFIERFESFANYMLRGEGRGILSEYPMAAELRKQVEIVDQFFTKTGVLQESSAARRVRELQREVENGSDS